MTSTDLNPSTDLTTTGAAGIAPVVTTLQTVWARLQKIQPTLPDATIVVKRDARAWGHTTTAKVWGAQKAKGRGKAKTVTLEAQRYEVMISGENLSRGPVAVLGTLLHEAAHALNLVAEVRDVDSNGRHNKAFKATAEQAWGLRIEDLGNWMGWTDTYVPDECAKRFSREVAMIAKALSKASVAHHPKAMTGTIVIVPPAPGKTKTGGRAKNLSRAVCECQPDATGWRPSLRASAKVLALGIRCEACDALFTVTGE